ncbi:flagellar basal body L-ring protein FlgH [Phyllobacterium sp. 0TCS1.6C]|jgi:flagellar L-ring protein FlgH|uniref:flagellar basal body L-ring protein FlgH n=1 Tax=unclassified Phyllobacterium TaxID=2638441 RepID=UPI0022648C6C|nr:MULTISPECIES: flagellar basal body L-ring protein FlgH [unclassified Phyllobacterium]MCX8280934.1 flagellar basal body L-ring protein FlgH [Phyllobacterium sp. 0TCS1.6C]MCX8295800.1 flagellar basal body L-ring protein FlgH [Phyllobacterium sp. 0TCS1.6A]
MNRAAVASLCLALLSTYGCATNPRDFNRPPEMSPVGAGIGHKYSAGAPSEYPAPPRPQKYSLWQERQVSFYRDPRAENPGDVLTVNISINDRATLDNKSNRSRVSSSIYGGTADISGSGITASDIGGNLDLSSDSRSKGEGKIERSEKIDLSVAAIVTDILPNGNLIIRGSQEIRVNNELRVLNVAGVVRPRDISRDNTISYDKIAEARISYGGRGRQSEVQQPAWGQQLLDAVSPI